MKMYSDNALTKEQVEEMINQVKTEMSKILFDNQEHLLKKLNRQKILTDITMAFAVSAVVISVLFKFF